MSDDYRRLQSTKKGDPMTYLRLRKNTSQTTKNNTAKKEVWLYTEQNCGGKELKSFCRKLYFGNQEKWNTKGLYTYCKNSTDLKIRQRKYSRRTFDIMQNYLLTLGSCRGFWIICKIQNIRSEYSTHRRTAQGPDLGFWEESIWHGCTP